jgi:hypothetical protein
MTKCQELRKLLVALFVLIVSAVIGVGLVMRNPPYDWGRVVKIDNATQARDIALEAEDKEGYVWGVRISITGYIDNYAIVQQYDTQNGRQYMMYENRIGKGRVSLSLDQDWYTESCLIRYKPQNVTSGNLQIRYVFKRIHETRYNNTQ